MYKVEAIVDKKIDKKTKKPYYFVKWEGYDVSTNTWQPIQHLTQYCQELIQEYEEKLKLQQQQSEKIGNMQNMEESIEKSAKNQMQSEEKSEREKQKKRRRGDRRKARKNQNVLDLSNENQRNKNNLVSQSEQQKSKSHEKNEKQNNEQKLKFHKRQGRSLRRKQKSSPEKMQDENEQQISEQEQGNEIQLQSSNSQLKENIRGKRSQFRNTCQALQRNRQVSRILRKIKKDFPQNNEKNEKRQKRQYKRLIVREKKKQSPPFEILYSQRQKKNLSPNIPVKKSNETSESKQKQNYQQQVKEEARQQINVLKFIQADFPEQKQPSQVKQRAIKNITAAPVKLAIQKPNPKSQQIQILGMRNEKGTLTFYVESKGVKSWRTHEQILDNYPRQLCLFYQKNLQFQQ